MQTLFPIEQVFPDGFSYSPDFITINEEERLLQEIHKIEMQTFVFQGFEAKRKMASFGYDYNFENRTLNKTRVIPEGFHFLLEKISSHTSIPTKEFAELLILEYPVGAVINWHRDAPPFDVIVGISLLSNCTFRLRPQEKEKQTSKSIISFPVERRSIYLMKGPARSEWQHSTVPVKEKRYSITLRSLRNNKSQNEHII